MPVTEKRNGKNVKIYYYAISDRLIDSQYANNSFPNSLVYSLACQSMKSSALGETFSRKGVGVYIGWNEVNCIGHTTGKKLFQALLNGFSVEDAYQSLQEEERRDCHPNHPCADLKYYPLSGGNMYLVEPEENPDWIEIGGVRWATRNVGAHGQFVANPEDFGGYYQWGRRGDGHQQPNSGTTATLSTTDNPGHGNFITTYITPYDWRTPQNNNLWGAVKTANDPCPAGWRVPTHSEHELLMDANSYWGELNGVNGYFIGDDEPKLFLPAAGCRVYSSGSLSGVGAYGFYWSSTPYSTSAYSSYFGSGNFNTHSNFRAFGFSVRCVSE